MEVATAAGTAVIDVEGLDALLRRLAGQGYRVIGPTVRDGAIVLDDVEGVADLPVGRGDEQEPGAYRLRQRGDDALFGYAVGPGSARRWLNPPSRTIWSATRTATGFVVDPAPDDPPPVALVGLRPCDLSAIAVQDRVLAGARPDRAYVRARESAFVVAVACGDPAATCFCTSMGTGPAPRSGFDLALTELLEPGHRFVVTVGTDRGAEVLAHLPTTVATAADLDAATAVTVRAAGSMRRRLDPEAARDVLAANPEHPHWDDVASRCLSCAGCTLVCPTCFCSSVADVTDLTGDHAARVQRWESCFTLGHAYVHGGSVRPDLRSRYRQWLTHKLSTWWDQQGGSGCVGCGRCIAWCPAGIDLTAEVAAIAGEPAGAGRGDGR